MALYAWKGLDAGGKNVGGTRDADGGKALRQALRKDGIFITELSEVLATGGGKAAKTSVAAGNKPKSLLKRDVNFGQLMERVRRQEIAVMPRPLAPRPAAGAPGLTAPEITMQVLNNTALERVVESARDAIREGESIAVTLRKSKQFPSMMVHMVSVGERSGQLETMLENVAAAYEREVDGKVARLTTILSPAIIVTMALVVVCVVFSILTPILDMQNFVQ